MRGDYRSVAIDEGKHAKSQPAIRKVDGSPSPLLQLLQWVCVICLILIGGVVLGAHHRGVSPGVLAQNTLAPHQGKGLRKRKHQAPSFMWAFGSSGHQVGGPASPRSRRKAVKRQAAKAAKRSVLLIGSHFRQGNSVLEQLFDDWCAKPRLALRCENSWAGKHDLEALASHSGPWRRRLVWLERDAPTMLRTLRGVGKFTQHLQFVQLLWDPLDACVGSAHTDRAAAARSPGWEWARVSRARLRLAGSGRSRSAPTAASPRPARGCSSTRSCAHRIEPRVPSRWPSHTAARHEPHPLASHQLRTSYGRCRCTGAPAATPSGRWRSSCATSPPPRRRAVAQHGMA